MALGPVIQRTGTGLEGVLLLIPGIELAFGRKLDAGTWEVCICGMILMYR